MLPKISACVTLHPVLQMQNWLNDSRDQDNVKNSVLWLQEYNTPSDNLIAHIEKSLENTSTNLTMLLFVKQGGGCHRDGYHSSDTEIQVYELIYKAVSKNITAHQWHAHLFQFFFSLQCQNCTCHFFFSQVHISFSFLFLLFLASSIPSCLRCCSTICYQKKTRSLPPRVSKGYFLRVSADGSKVWLTLSLEIIQN